MILPRSGPFLRFYQGIMHVVLSDFFNAFKIKLKIVKKNRTSSRRSAPTAFFKWIRPCLSIIKLISPLRIYFIVNALQSMNVWDNLSNLVRDSLLSIRKAFFENDFSRILLLEFFHFLSECHLVHYKVSISAHNPNPGMNFLLWRSKRRKFLPF